jgi:hypothetical protein
MHLIHGETVSGVEGLLQYALIGTMQNHALILSIFQHSWENKRQMWTSNVSTRYATQAVLYSGYLWRG